jgi:transcriptional regulator with XRE-family HTH domain
VVSNSGELIRQARLRRGWSGQQLAEEIQKWEYEHGRGENLGIDRGYVSLWEQGRRGVSAAYARRLEAVLGIEAGQLLTDRRVHGEATTSPNPGDEAARSDTPTHVHAMLQQLHDIMSTTKIGTIVNQGIQQSGGTMQVGQLAVGPGAHVEGPAKAPARPARPGEHRDPVDEQDSQSKDDRPA